MIVKLCIFLKINNEKKKIINSKLSLNNKINDGYKLLFYGLIDGK